MKIRIKGNSIRYRLTKTEISNFGKNGFLEEQTNFPNGNSFKYRLEKNKELANLAATFEGNTVTIQVPLSIADEWTNSEIVGYDHKQKLKEGELFILIEKDFVCLDHTFEDQSDNYPNPNKTCAPGQE